MFAHHHHKMYRKGSSQGTGAGGWWGWVLVIPLSFIIGIILAAYVIPKMK